VVGVVSFRIHLATANIQCNYFREGISIQPESNLYCCLGWQIGAPGVCHCDRPLRPSGVLEIERSGTWHARNERPHGAYWRCAASLPSPWYRRNAGRDVRRSVGSELTIGDIPYPLFKNESVATWKSI